jgi:hypothetical protein
MNIRIPLRFRRHDEAVAMRDPSIDSTAKPDDGLRTFLSIPFEGLIADISKFPRLHHGEARFPQRSPTPSVPPSHAFKTLIIAKTRTGFSK